MLSHPLPQRRVGFSYIARLLSLLPSPVLVNDGIFTSLLLPFHTCYLSELALRLASSCSSSIFLLHPAERKFHYKTPPKEGKDDYESEN